MKTKTFEEQMAAIQAILEELDGEGDIYEGYSGRCMFGRRCLGISHHDRNDVIVAVGKLGLPKPSIDNFGRDWIFYWPSWEMPKENAAEVESSVD